MIRYEPTNNFFPKYCENNFDTSTEFLQEKGKTVLKYNKKKLFFDYCRYGYLFNRVFYLYREKLIRKKVNILFSNFVEYNFVISDRQALELRRIGEL